MAKLIALFDLLRVGHAVDDPAKWKTRQITATALAPLLVALVALAKAYGVQIPISDDDCLQLAGGLVVLVNVVLTLATSTRVGIARAKDGGGVDEAPAAVPPPGPDEASAPEGAIPQVLPNEPERTDPFAAHGS